MIPTVRQLIYGQFYDEVLTAMAIQTFQREFLFCVFIHTGVEPLWDKENMSQYYYRCTEAGKITKAEGQILAQWLVDSIEFNPKKA